MTCHSKISKIDGVLAKKGARVAATVFQEEAFISGLLLENSWKDPVKIPMKWRSRANQKSIKNEPKTDPRRGTPSGGARENRWFYSWVPFFAAKLRLCWGIWLHFATQFQLKRARFFSPDRRQYWRFLNDRSQVKRGGGHAA